MSKTAHHSRGDQNKDHLRTRALGPLTHRCRQFVRGGKWHSFPFATPSSTQRSRKDLISVSHFKDEDAEPPPVHLLRVTQIRHSLSPWVPKDLTAQKNFLPTQTHIHG